MKLNWTRHAKSQLADIFEHIAADSLDAAVTQTRLITESADLLSRFTGLGRSGRIQGTREFPVSRTSYVIAYRALPDSLQILAIQHGAQLWPRSFIN